MPDNSELGNFDRKNVVDAYDARPAYAPAAFHMLVEAGFIGVNDRLLDMGTGNGRGLKSMFDYAANADDYRVARLMESLDIQAVDPSPRMIAAAREAFPDIQYHQGRFEDVPLADHSVDVVMGASSWHWGLNTPEKKAQTNAEIARILKPGGRIISLTDTWQPTIAEDSPLTFVIAQIKSNLMAEYLNDGDADLIKPLSEPTNGVFPRNYAIESIESLNLDGMIDTASGKDVFVGYANQVLMLPLEQVKMELATQVYFDVLSDERKEAIWRRLDNVASPDETGCVEVSRKTVAVAGYGRANAMANTL